MASQLNVVDRMVAFFSASKGIRRFQERQYFEAIKAATRGYEAARPSRKRPFSRDNSAGNALARWSAVAIRNQARQLERDHDIARGILDKLVDFTIGPNGITVEPQPKRIDGTLHEDLAAELDTMYRLWSEWPEVTWTHSRPQMERLAQRSRYRDGEVFGQMVSGWRDDLQHGSAVPLSIQMIEADQVPFELDYIGNGNAGLRQGIETDAWGRAIAYHVYRHHPGDERGYPSLDTLRILSESMLHVRCVDRIGQLRGISAFAPIITRLQDIFDYEDNERIAAKLASSLVFGIQTGDPASFDPSKIAYDPQHPPIYRLDGGMVVASPHPGAGVTMFDTKRPNTNAEPFVNGQLRRVSSGVGLSYSAVSRDYNGTYSAQRQELVENWPHYHAETGVFVAQWSRPSYQALVRWWALARGTPLPADLDRSTLADAEFLGPSMPVIDPEKEVNSQIMLVQAAFKSSSQVIRQLGGNLTETYRQIEAERKQRELRRIPSVVDVPSAYISPAKPSLPEPAAQSGAHLRVVK